MEGEEGLMGGRAGMKYRVVAAGRAAPCDEARERDDTNRSEHNSLLLQFIRSVYTSLPFRLFYKIEFFISIQM